MYAPWFLADLGIYWLGYMDRLNLVRILGFIAIFLSVLFFALDFRSVRAGKENLPRTGFRIAVWSTLSAGFIYLISSRVWR
jgi:hypothetical protein